jgi:hypothetical protein
MTMFLLSVTVSREKDEIAYKLGRSSSLTNGELECYLKEITEGTCKLKPSVCKEAVRNFKGTIRKGKPKRNEK